MVDQALPGAVNRRPWSLCWCAANVAYHRAMAFQARAVLVFGAVALGVACTSGGVDGPASPPPSDEAGGGEEVEAPEGADAGEPTPEPSVAPSPDADEVDPPPALEPIGTRISARQLVAYASPSSDAEFRGSIPRQEPFYVYAFVEGSDCRGEGWAQVSAGAFACLERAEATETTPVVLPRVPEGDVVPFTYAKPRKTADGSPPVVNRWRTRHAFNGGKPHRDTLIADASYSFVRRRGNGRRPALLIDAKKRAVPAEQMRRYRPSEFVGRDLVADPVPAGKTVAWTRIRDTAILAEPRAGAKVVSEPRYHAQVLVEPGPDRWLEVLDTGHGISGFIDARHVRSWDPPPPEPRMRADLVWIDVDLLQQTLTVMRGDVPIYATLVSTGKSGDATPTGLFRIYKKKALDDMQSAEGADDPYFVEDVPWAQYFHRDFALHTAYWHDLFGNRTSHGCVNLSPRDGAHVYALTRPAPIPGWNSVTETPAAPGTTVRVRKGDSSVPDRRPALSTTAEATRE